MDEIGLAGERFQGIGDAKAREQPRTIRTNLDAGTLGFVDLPLLDDVRFHAVLGERQRSRQSTDAAAEDQQRMTLVADCRMAARPDVGHRTARAGIRLFHGLQPRVAHLTFGPRLGPVSQPNVMCKSYTRSMMMLVFRFRHLLASRC